MTFNDVDDDDDDDDDDNNNDNNLVSNDDDFGKFIAKKSLASNSKLFWDRFIEAAN